MSKKPLKPVSTEIVTAGQPSATLIAELKSIGEHLSIEQIAKALGHVEASRVRFVVEAVATGVLLLAKKQTLEHGSWQKFCAEVWEAMDQSGNGVSTLDSPAALNNFTRSLRHYTFLGQHFLADLEQGNFQPDGELPAEAPKIAADEVLALETLPQEKRVQVYNAIERFVAGRSLRRILMDFRRAENAADQEEIEDEKAAKGSKKPKPPAPGQMEFNDLLVPLQTIETLFETKSFLKRTDRAFWTSVADRLEVQAKRARQLAKEFAK